MALNIAASKAEADIQKELDDKVAHDRLMYQLSMMEVSHRKNEYSLQVEEVMTRYRKQIASIRQLQTEALANNDYAKGTFAPLFEKAVITAQLEFEELLN